jgi:hypothetical protein
MGIMRRALWARTHRRVVVKVVVVPMMVSPELIRVAVVEPQTEVATLVPAVMRE